MRSRKLKGALGLGFTMLVAASAVLACTHDFDAYEPGSGVVAPGVDGQAADGSTTQPGTDGSVTPTDGSTTKDGAPPPDCTTKASCAATQTSCASACEATRTTCTAGCSQGGPGNKCRNDCNDARDLCVSNCRSTCRTCAGTACADSVCK